MGKVILVPPPTRMEYLKPNPSMPSYSTHMVYPVMFNMPTSGEHVALNATISIPCPTTANEFHDPLAQYARYYNFTTHNGYSGSYLIHRLRDTEMARAFWGHQEVEEVAAGLHGDLLIQIEEGDDQRTPSWNFMATDSRDAHMIGTFTYRIKNHRFETPGALRDEILVWLNQNVTGDWDLNRNQWSGGKDEFFIRKDVEAIHFKMKWFGVEPEEATA